MVISPPYVRPMQHDWRTEITFVIYRCTNINCNNWMIPFTLMHRFTMNKITGKLIKKWNIITVRFFSYLKYINIHKNILRVNILHMFEQSVKLHCNDNKYNWIPTCKYVIPASLQNVVTGVPLMLCYVYKSISFNIKLPNV